MTLRLTLLCAGATAIGRAGGFAPPDAPLDPTERARAARWVSSFDRIVASPAAAARETAAAMGLVAAPDARLADADHGAWTGLGFAEVQACDPAGLGAWLAAPEQGTPGGEPFTAVMARVTSWLDEAGEGRVLAVTHPMAARAILATTMGLTPAAVMRIDLAPLGRVALSRHRGWRLQALIPRGAGK